MSPKVTEYIKWLNAQNAAPDDTPAPNIDDPEVQEYIKTLNSTALQTQASAPQTARQAQPAYKPAPKPIEQPLSKSNARFVLLYAAIIGLTFSVCFAGWDVKPFFALPIFAIIAFVAGAFALKSSGKFINNKAWLWGIPILLTSIPGALFGESAGLLFFDIIALHLLFAVFGLSATGKNAKDLFRIIFTNPFHRFYFFKTAFGGKEADADKGGVKKAPKIVGQIFLGLLIALVPVIIIIAILANADPAFGKFVGDIIDAIINIDILKWIWNILVFALATLYAMNYIYKVGFVEYPKNEAAKAEPKKIFTFASAAIISSLNLVYIGFTYIQITHLWGGGRPTLEHPFQYADFARNGFFELLFVSAINFGVIALFLWLLRGHKGQKILKVLISLLCVLTGVLIASSFTRVFLYINHINITKGGGFTSLRLAVITFLLFEAALVALGFYYTWIQGKHIFRSFAIVSLIFLIIASFTFTDQFANLLNSGTLNFLPNLQNITHWQNINILK